MKKGLVDKRRKGFRLKKREAAERAKGTQIRKKRREKGLWFLAFFHLKGECRDLVRKNVSFHFCMVSARIFIFWGLCPLFVSLYFKFVYPYCNHDVAFD